MFVSLCPPASEKRPPLGRDLQIAVQAIACPTTIYLRVYWTGALWSPFGTVTGTTTVALPFFTVILAEPGPTAVTTPSALTVTTDRALDSYFVSLERVRSTSASSAKIPVVHKSRTSPTP